MAMPIDYTLPLFDLVQNYMLNVTLIAANECFKPLLNDYKVESTAGPDMLIIEVNVTGTYDRNPVSIRLLMGLGDRPSYYQVRVIANWEREPNHAPFDMSFQSRMDQHPIKKFDEIRNTFIAALAAKE